MLSAFSSQYVFSLVDTIALHDSAAVDTIALSVSLMLSAFSSQYVFSLVDTIALQHET
jgi:hypothetical protein